MSNQLLAEAVKQRRLGLGLSQTEVQMRGGPSPALLSKIENARHDELSGRTLAQLETALDWSRGSAAAILAGGVADIDESTPTELEEVGAALLHLVGELRLLRGEMAGDVAALRKALDRFEQHGGGPA